MSGFHNSYNGIQPETVHPDSLRLLQEYNATHNRPNEPQSPAAPLQMPQQALPHPARSQGISRARHPGPLPLGEMPLVNNGEFDTRVQYQEDAAIVGGGGHGGDCALNERRNLTIDSAGGHQAIPPQHIVDLSHLQRPGRQLPSQLRPHGPIDKTFRSEYLKTFNDAQWGNQEAYSDLRNHFVENVSGRFQAQHNMSKEQAKSWLQDQCILMERELEICASICVRYRLGEEDCKGIVDDKAPEATVLPIPDDDIIDELVGHMEAEEEVLDLHTTQPYKFWRKMTRHEFVGVARRILVGLKRQVCCGKIQLESFETHFKELGILCRLCKGSVVRMSRPTTMEDIVATPRKMCQRFMDNQINNLKKKGGPGLEEKLSTFKLKKQEMYAKMGIRADREPSISCELHDELMASASAEKRRAEDDIDERPPKTMRSASRRLRARTPMSSPSNVLSRGHTPSASPMPSASHASMYRDSVSSGFGEHLSSERSLEIEPPIDYDMPDFTRQQPNTDAPPIIFDDAAANATTAEERRAISEFILHTNNDELRSMYQNVSLGMWREWMSKNPPASPGSVVDLTEPPFDLDRIPHIPPECSFERIQQYTQVEAPEYDTGAYSDASIDEGSDDSDDSDADDDDHDYNCNVPENSKDVLVALRCYLPVDAHLFWSSEEGNPFIGKINNALRRKAQEQRAETMPEVIDLVSGEGSEAESESGTEEEASESGSDAGSDEDPEADGDDVGDGEAVADENSEVPDGGDRDAVNPPAGSTPIDPVVLDQQPFQEDTRVVFDESNNNAERSNLADTSGTEATITVDPELTPADLTPELLREMQEVYHNPLSWTRSLSDIIDGSNIGLTDVDGKKAQYQSQLSESFNPEDYLNFDAFAENENNAFAASGSGNLMDIELEDLFGNINTEQSSTIQQLAAQPEIESCVGFLAML